MHDRRQMDGNAAISLCVVRIVGTVAVLATTGALGLIGLGFPVPSEVWMLVTGSTSGLVGFLTHNPKHPPGANVGPVEHMTVEAAEPKPEVTPDA